MLQQTTDVPASGVGEQCVLGLVEEQGLAVFPQALVDVHTAAVVAENGLGHERGAVAVFFGGRADDVFVLLQLVCHG